MMRPSSRMISACCRRDLNHGQIGKNQQPCRFRQLSAPDIVVKGHAHHSGEYTVQMKSGIVNGICHLFQIQMLVQMGFNIGDCFCSGFGCKIIHS